MDSTSRGANGSRQNLVILSNSREATDSAYNARMDEHRSTPRRRILKTGSIEFAGSKIACTVRNLSEAGAALEVVTPLFIPERFTLVMPSEPLKRPCHIVWRKDKRIGVAFD